MITALRIHIQKLKVRYPGASSYVDMEGDMQGLIGMVHAGLIGKLRVAALSERTLRAQQPEIRKLLHGHAVAAAPRTCSCWHQKQCALILAPIPGTKLPRTRTKSCTREKKVLCLRNSFYSAATWQRLPRRREPARLHGGASHKPALPQRGVARVATWVRISAGTQV